MRGLLRRLVPNPAASPPKRITALSTALLALAVVAPAATARTVTLHYFSRQTSSVLVNAQGQPVTPAPNSPPAVGDIFDNTGVDYVGSHKHHAKQATASDHLRCTITSVTATGGEATCDGQIAIGGSMLLANGAPLTLSEGSAPAVLSINAGTGIYRHAHGKIVATQRGNNSDLTVKVTH